MRFPFFRNRDSVKNGILISIRRTGDGFHPGLFSALIALKRNTFRETTYMILSAVVIAVILNMLVPFHFG